MSHVAVLMATFNGGRFVAEQLVSLAGQSAAAFDLMVSDDGSTDDTRAKLESARTRWRKGRFDIISGPRDGGHAGNFRHLFLALNDDPVAALSAASSQRHADARRPQNTLEQFRRIRRRRWLSPRLLWRSGIYRQTLGGHAMLYVAALLGLA